MSATEKGYILYDCRWVKAEPAPGAVITELEQWRGELRKREMIGLYPNGFGFGNISIRSNGGFIISGTHTGGLAVLGPEHYTKVTQYSFADNCLTCEGPLKASSEALSHAALYAVEPGIGAVIHIHHDDLWEAALNVLPTTDPQAAPGTPDMAYAIQAVYGEAVEARLIVMGGHEPGLISFGGNLGQAGEAILSAYDKFVQTKPCCRERSGRV